MVPTESLLVMSGMDDSRLTSLLGQVDHILLSNDQLVLKLAHLLAIRRHERALAGGLLHDLVNDQLRVTTNVQPCSTELDGDA